MDWAEHRFHFLANRGQAHRGCCLAGLGASPGWYCKSVKPWAIALRLDSDQETADFCAAYLAGLGASPG